MNGRAHPIRPETKHIDSILEHAILERMNLRFAVGFLFPILLTATAPNCAAFGWYSNVLLNAGFEQGTSDTNVTHWFRFNNAYRYQSSEARSGTHAIAAWGNWWPDGEWNASGLYQQHSVTGGQIWEASAWFKVGVPIEGSAFAAISLEFYTAQTQRIYQGRSAERITAATPTGQWFRITAKARANHNAAWIRMLPLFVQSPDFENGSVWMDDCELYTVPPSIIEFAGREWLVADYFSDPGGNYFSTNCVWVDTNGWLHMELKEVNGVWRCPGLKGTESLGFGEYRWYIGNRVDLLDPTLVGGLFTYAPDPVYGTNQNEVDIEFSHALPGTQPNNLFYTVQPYTIPGNGYQHPMNLMDDLTTHRFIWRPDRIDWQSYYGHLPEPEEDTLFIAGWRFERRGIPIETNELPMMNLWLLFDDAPSDTQHINMIIHDFEFVPFDGFIFTDGFDAGAVSSAWTQVGASVRITNDSLFVSPDSAAAAGLMRTQTVHRNERGERYIFSGLLRTVSVHTARSGEDVRGILALTTEPLPYLDANTAAHLQAQYDSEHDTITWAFFTKDFVPGGDGSLRFMGTTTNVTHYFSTGGIDARIELDPGTYRIAPRDAQGRPVNLATNHGAAEDVSHLYEWLTPVYWFIGAANSDAASAGSVVWDRTTIGIAGQTEPFPLMTMDMNQGVSFLSSRGFFDARCDIEKTTNLLAPFSPYQTNLAVTTPFFVFTNTIVPGEHAAFYRMRMSDDAQAPGE